MTQEQDNRPSEALLHEYEPRNLGHSTVACKWCHGTPNENAIIEPVTCSERAKFAAAHPSPAPTSDEAAVEAVATFLKRLPIGDFPGKTYAERLATAQSYIAAITAYKLACPVEPARVIIRTPLDCERVWCDAWAKWQQTGKNNRAAGDVIATALANWTAGGGDGQR